jgi:hypothetical protein
MGIATMRAALLVAIFFCLADAAPARADFAEGLAAYDAGDYDSALGAWRPLAEAGDPEAQVALAGLFLDGLGVGADAVEAARWYRRAADRGDPVAQLNLGDLYRRGVGLERNLVQAYFWFSLAAAQGRRWAESRRGAIAAGLSAAQRAEAERLIAAWRATD